MLLEVIRNFLMESLPQKNANSLVVMITLMNFLMEQKDGLRTCLQISTKRQLGSLASHLTWTALKSEYKLTTSCSAAAQKQAFHIFQEA